MAVVTTSLTPNVTTERFVSPGMLAGDTEGLPIGRVNVSNNFTTTGVGAGDTEALSIQMDFPLSYFYRLLSLGVTFYSGTSGSVGAWGDSNWLVEFRQSESTYYTELQPVTSYAGGTPNRQSQYGSLSTEYSLTFRVADPAILGQVIDGRGTGASKTPARVVIRAYNSTSGLNAVSANLRMTGLQYTVEDSLAYPLWATGNLINQ